MPLTINPPTPDLVDLVHALGGTWHGYTAMCLCPAHADSQPSLSIRQGDRGILVTCFAGCAREDILRELSRVRTVPRAGRWEPAPARRPVDVERIWNNAIDVRGSLAERYLGGRGLDGIPPDTRFHPRCPYLPRPQTQFLPALLVAVREGNQLTAIQRIFLDPQTTRYTHKVMLGHPAAGAWQGGWPGGELAIAEGFETARAFTLLNDIPCWGSLGARRLDLLQIPDRIARLVIAEDNDGPGRDAAQRCIERYSREGLVIERRPPPAGVKDWAQLVEGRSRR